MNCTWKASRCVSGLQDLAHHKVRLFPQRKGQSDVWMHGFRPQNPSANWLPLPSPTTLHNSSPAQPKLPAKIYPVQCTCPCCSLRHSPGFLSELRPPVFSRPFLPAKEATSVRMGGGGTRDTSQPKRNDEPNSLLTGKTNNSSFPSFLAVRGPEPRLLSSRDFLYCCYGFQALICSDLRVNQFRIHFRGTLASHAGEFSA